MMAAEEAALMAEYKLHPWGEARSEIMLAQIAQILWNANTSKKDKRKKLTDFLPFRKKEEPEDVEGQVKSAFMTIANRAKALDKPQWRPFEE